MYRSTELHAVVTQDKAFVGLDVHKEKIAVGVAMGREAPVFRE